MKAFARRRRVGHRWGSERRTVTKEDVDRVRLYEEVIRPACATEIGPHGISKIG